MKIVSRIYLKLIAPSRFIRIIVTLLTAILVCLDSLNVQAQSYYLKPVDEKKPFSLYIYHGPDGKGAFVHYYGRTGLIALKLVEFKGNGSNYYKWIEVVEGKEEINSEPAGKGIQKMLVNDILTCLVFIPEVVSFPITVE